MKQIKINSDREKLNRLQTDELDKLLQAELRKNGPDEEVVLSILGVLRDREAGDTEEISEATMNAWYKIQENHKTRKADSSVKKREKAKASFYKRMVAVVAVASLLLFVVPYAFGYESIIEMIGSWTDSIFSFNNNGEDPFSEEYVFVTDNPGLQQVYDAVVEQGIIQPVVPMWLPENFVLEEIKTTTMPKGNKLNAHFSDGADVVVLTFYGSAQVAAQYEKAESDAYVYEAERVKHYIVENSNTSVVIWGQDNVECSIMTSLDKENVFKIIDSIYGSDT